MKKSDLNFIIDTQAQHIKRQADDKLRLVDKLNWAGQLDDANRATLDALEDLVELLREKLAAAEARATYLSDLNDMYIEELTLAAEQANEHEAQIEALTDLVNGLANAFFTLLVS